MAALRAREVDPTVTITMVVADRYPNFSICGLPFYVSGEVPDWQALAHRSADDIAKRGIKLLLAHSANRLDPGAKTLLVVDEHGHERTLSYDTVVIATGARPRTAGIEGIGLPGVYPLHTMADSFVLRAHVERAVKHVAVVGTGYIGLEMADAFAHRGIGVRLLGRANTVMPT